jgi:hypothetical protein
VAQTDAPAGEAAAGGATAAATAKAPDRADAHDQTGAAADGSPSGSA